MCGETCPGAASSDTPSHVMTERQDSADDRTEVYQEGSYHVALCLLRIVEHVGHQRSEGLHRDVERQIHEQQDESPHGERGEGEQFGAVGHEHQRQRRDQRSAQDVGDAAAPARPGAVGKEPHDGLDDHAGQRCRQPEVAQVARHLPPAIRRCSTCWNSGANIRSARRGSRS